MSRRDCLLAALVASIWGFNFVVIDWGMGGPDGVAPLLFVAIRFAVVVFPAVLLVPRPALPWRTVAAIGVFMSMGQFGLLYLAMAAGMPPGIAALVLQAQVILTVALAALTLRERPRPLQLAGVLLGCAGLAVVALGRGGDVPLGALLVCLLAAFSWAIGNVLSRASGAAADSTRSGAGLSLTVWSATVVPIPLVLLALIVDGPAGVAHSVGAFGWEAGVSTLYTAGLASLVGYGVFNGLLARNPSASVVPWVLLAPVVAMCSAWLLLGDVPTAGEAAGGVVMVSGVLIAMRGAGRRLAPPLPTPPVLPAAVSVPTAAR
ncbi:EamA family transporter [Nocardioides sp. R-C-SC26]|uniref:EamA family transporter n=1 Tax=Nocardioides sp. R-C-SC26 TaxID=2870414 RepID=UPI001E53D6BB|nr:EamA family transporter [Nocardioides sp. R-C-SC26]